MIQVKLKAKIDKTEFANGKNYLVVITPAPDEYTQPQRFKLMDDSTGIQYAPGAQYEFSVNMSGFVKSKQYKDKETGAPKIYDEANVYFQVLTAKPVSSAAPVARAS